MRLVQATGDIDLIDATDAAGWHEALERVGVEGGYYSAGYHRLAQLNGDGTGALAVYREGPHVIALPMLWRVIPTTIDRCDITSVYGYAGPLHTDPLPPAEVLERFRSALRDELRSRGAVSLFTRLNPFRPEQRAVVEGLGHTIEMGPVVAIDLTQSEDDQRAAYGRSTRRAVRRAIAKGYEVLEDEAGIYLPDVVDLYLATMERAGADPRYRFGMEHFTRLFEDLGTSARLFVSLLGDTVLSGSIYLVEGAHVHAHLGATKRTPAAPSPMTLETDVVRQWAAAEGHHWLNLGGGLGSTADSLLTYKAGFSSTTLPFHTWQWVIDEDSYAQLCQQPGGGRDCSFFPAYRGPA